MSEVGACGAEAIAEVGLGRWAEADLCPVLSDTTNVGIAYVRRVNKDCGRVETLNAFEKLNRAHPIMLVASLVLKNLLTGVNVKGMLRKLPF